MMIYFTRHGETEWNSRNIICGRTDIDLSDRGREQAAALGNSIGHDSGICRIISSPMKRAMETARIISERTGIPISGTDVRLTEWDYGVFEGQPRDTPGFAENKLQFGCRMPGGESVLDLAARVYGFIDEAAEKYAGEDILLVCHGGVCRVIETYFRDMTRKEFSEFFMGNCELRKFNRKDDKI